MRSYNPQMAAHSEEAIDDSLYSRQRYVLGDGAMVRMARARVFIHGLSGLGVEVAKSITLAGVKSVTLHDDKQAAHTDLATQFYLNEAHVAAHANR